MKRIILACICLGALITSCNKDWEFPDYKYTTVYFAYQTPVRTLVLGEDIYDNSLDNQHKCMIMATMGGVYENKNNITLNLSVDNSLAQNVKFNSATGDSIAAMPANYYSFPQGELKIVIPSGKLTGGIEVQLTDAFFNDPGAIKKRYVIPLKITSVTNADSVLRGASTLPNPDRRKASDWTTVPKDYILYAVKYVNPYHGTYLRRGKDVVTGAGGNTSLDTNVVYRKTYVEQDEVCNLYTRSLTQDTISLNAKNKGNVNTPFKLLVNFATNGSCTIAAPAGASYTVNGTGSFVKKGDMWGNERRDVLYLDYQIDFGTTLHNLTDTLVLRDRAVGFETFSIF